MHNAVENLRNGKPFCFSRWGDGEWTAVLGMRKGKANTDGHEYFDDMRDALAGVLESRPDYHLGMQPLSRRVMGEAIDAWLAERGLAFDWENADVFHRAAQANDWGFRDALLSRNPTCVGPAHLRPLFAAGRYIEIPAKNCWLATDEIVPRIIAEATDCVAFCASMAANVWIDRVHKARPDATLIDFGSVFDPLCGVKSRGYMRA
jgi:hypothetical protein